MMATRPKYMALFILLGIWGTIAAWLFFNSTEPKHLPLQYVSGQTSTRGAVRGQGDPALRINLALFTLERQNVDQAFTAPKNIFMPLKTELTKSAPALSSHVKRDPPHREPVVQPTVQPLVPPLVPPPAPIASTVPAAPLVPTPEELAKQTARQELAKYRYLGYLSRGGRDEAFLSKGNDLHIVKVGETIEQRVLIQSIGPTSVVLKETISQLEQTVSLNK